MESMEHPGMLRQEIEKRGKDKTKETAHITGKAMESAVAGIIRTVMQDAGAAALLIALFLKKRIIDPIPLIFVKTPLLN